MKIPQVEYFGPYSDRAIHDASSFPKAHSSDVQSYSLLHSRCRNPSLEDGSEDEGVALPASKPGASRSPIGQLFVEHLHPSFARFPNSLREITAIHAHFDLPFVLHQLIAISGWDFTNDGGQRVSYAGDCRIDPIAVSRSALQFSIVPVPP